MLDASAGSRPADSTRLAIDIGSVAKGYIHADLSGEPVPRVGSRNETV